MTLATRATKAPREWHGDDPRLRALRDPANWNAAFGNGFHVVPGQEGNTQSAATWTSWAQNEGVTGGFYYPDLAWVPGANWGVIYMADALGLPPL